MNSLTSEQATEVGGLGAAGLAGGGGVAAAVPSLEQAFSLSSPVQPGESVKRVRGNPTLTSMSGAGEAARGGLGVLSGPSPEGSESHQSSSMFDGY